MRLYFSDSFLGKSKILKPVGLNTGSTEILSHYKRLFEKFETLQRLDGKELCTDSIWRPRVPIAGRLTDEEAVKILKETQAACGTGLWKLTAVGLSLRRMPRESGPSRRYLGIKPWEDYPKSHPSLL